MRSKDLRMNVCLYFPSGVVSSKHMLLVSGAELFMWAPLASLSGGSAVLISFQLGGAKRQDNFHVNRYV